MDPKMFPGPELGSFIRPTNGCFALCRRKLKLPKQENRSARNVQSLPPVRGSSQLRSLTPSLPRTTKKYVSPQRKTVRKTAESPDRTADDSLYKRISKEESLLISLKNYKLPARFPERFATCLTYKNDKGEDIPLLHRDQVTRVLQRLDKDVQPVLNKFNFSYSSLSENHPQLSKAAYTNRIPLKFDDELQAFAYYIMIRVRNKGAPNDVAKFYNRSTLLAVLFHELAHLRYMNHGPEFTLFLRDIFKYARKQGIFKLGEMHQIPSCRKWENLLFETGGEVSDADLASLHNLANTEVAG